METEQTIKIIPAERAVETKESIELSMTAKGLYQWTIKLKDEVITKETLKRLIELENNLKTNFPGNCANQQ